MSEDYNTYLFKHVTDTAMNWLVCEFGVSFEYVFVYQYANDTTKPTFMAALFVRYFFSVTERYIIQFI